MPLLIAQHDPPKLARTRNSFQTLARAIVYQQLSGKAAGTIYSRFLDLFGSRRFPSPAALAAMPFERLRSAGLSNAKAAYLLDLAANFDDGTIRPRRFSSMTNDELSASLTKIKGVGQWSVDMFLIFGLNRPDVLPVGDLAIRKGMQAYFRLRTLPKPARMVKLAEPWRPYRTIGSWYMWRASEGGLP